MTLEEAIESCGGIVVNLTRLRWNSEQHVYINHGHFFLADNDRREFALTVEDIRATDWVHSSEARSVRMAQSLSPAARALIARGRS